MRLVGHTSVSRLDMEGVSSADSNSKKDVTLGRMHYFNEYTDKKSLSKYKADKFDGLEQLMIQEQEKTLKSKDGQDRLVVFYETFKLDKETRKLSDYRIISTTISKKELDRRESHEQYHRDAHVKNLLQEQKANPNANVPMKNIYTKEFTDKDTYLFMDIMNRKNNIGNNEEIDVFEPEINYEKTLSINKNDFKIEDFDDKPSFRKLLDNNKKSIMITATILSMAFFALSLTTLALPLVFIAGGLGLVAAFGLELFRPTIHKNYRTVEDSDKIKQDLADIQSKSTNIDAKLEDESLSKTDRDNLLVEKNELEETAVKKRLLLLINNHHNEHYYSYNPEEK